MSDELHRVVARLCEVFGPLRWSEFQGQTRVVIPREHLFAALKLLKEELGFDMLIDVTCVDYLYYPRPPAEGRFGLVYSLLDTKRNLRVFVRTFLNLPDLEVPSVVPLWEAANWLERELYDMFGIKFTGHPDLRRILLPEGVVDHPLRKDYPLQGRGERHNLPVITRAEG